MREDLTSSKQDRIAIQMVDVGLFLAMSLFVLIIPSYHRAWIAFVLLAASASYHSYRKENMLAARAGLIRLLIWLLEGIAYLNGLTPFYAISDKMVLIISLCAGLVVLVHLFVVLIFLSRHWRRLSNAFPATVKSINMKTFYTYAHFNTYGGHLTKMCDTNDGLYISGSPFLRIKPALIPWSGIKREESGRKIDRIRLAG